ncbi:MAG: Lrp/AsnC family transcriptional regulator, partial [Candidatus Korarchaeum sp.]|nr:Lrp/AsnC family transcriptional regulator [Candidatus Korarchaeum sp.]MDW8035239.1 Lrp/AsnC family transcriptional regulator [Candidatus Korarchaeum sp.]
ITRDGRVSFKRIAERLGISDVAVRKRVRRLERLGVIEGFTVKLNPALLGYSIVSLTGVDVEPGEIVKVAREIANKDYAKSVAITAGDHSIMVELWARDESEMDRILKEIKEIRGVTRVCPAMITQRVKESCI